MATLRVLNLNIMHGRNARSSVFPVRTPQAAVVQTLCRIADIIARHDSDIIALQEVDGYSWFNGRMDQLNELASHLRYPYRFQADNWRVGLLGRTIHRTGVALLSRYPLEQAAGIDFARSFPTPRKGACAAIVHIPGGPPITIASVHLVWIDWLRRASRLHQARRLADALGAYPRPLIVTGDFNCRLAGTRERTLPFLLGKLDLHAYEPGSRTMDTWPAWQPTERDDWILISRGCSFLAHETFSDRHSDHLAVAATIELPD